MFDVELLLKEYIEENKKIRSMLFKMLEEYNNNETLHLLPPEYIAFYVKTKES